MAIDKQKLSITFGDGGELEKVGDWSISGRTATIKVRGVKAGRGTFTIKYDGKGDKTGTITVVDIPTIGELTAAASSVEIGDKIKFTLAFDIAPSLEDVTFTIPEGMTEVSSSKAIEGTNVVVEATMNTAGEKTVKASYKGTEKTVQVTGTEPAMRDATAEPESINKNEESTVTVNFN